MSFYIIVFLTTSHKKEALEFVHCLPNERLIACANIVDPVSSLFWWEEKIDEASEFLVVMKSRRGFFKKLFEKVKELHSYEVPEILELPITEGLPSYLEWMSASLHGEGIA